MIDEKELIKDIRKWKIEFMSHWYSNGEIKDMICDVIECQDKTREWIPCSESKITAEQKCIADLVNFAMTVSDKLKKKDFSLFSPTSGIGGGMKIGMPPICRMSDELLSLHEEVINEAMRAKKDEQMD